MKTAPPKNYSMKKMKLKIHPIKRINSNSIYQLLVGGILFIIGILVSDIPAMIASIDWPNTEGIIISRTFLGQKFKEYDGDYYTNIDGYIRYEFIVDGISYTSSAINSINSPYYPYELTKKYPEGALVTVYYNPRNPSKAILEPGFVYSSSTFDIFLLLFTGAGFYFIFNGIRSIFKNHKEYLE